MTDIPTRCPFCSSTNLAHIHGPSWTGSKEEWHIVDCIECGAYWKRGDYMDRNYPGIWFGASGKPAYAGSTETNDLQQPLQQRLKRLRMAQKGGGVAR